MNMELIKTKCLSAYNRAVKADDNLDLAIKNQFGQQATRWDHTSGEFNRETLKALTKKYEADSEYFHLSGLLNNLIVKEVNHER